MPLVAVNLSDKLLQEIRSLVNTGRYATLESFIEIGAFNQLALERGATPAAVIERGHRRVPSESEPKQEVAQVTNAKAFSATSAPAARKRPVADKAKRVDVIEPVTDEEAKALFAAHCAYLDECFAVADAAEDRARPAHIRAG